MDLIRDSSNLWTPTIVVPPGEQTSSFSFPGCFSVDNISFPAPKCGYCTTLKYLLKCNNIHNVIQRFINKKDKNCQGKNTIKNFKVLIIFFLIKSVYSDFNELLNDGFKKQKIKFLLDDK